MKQRTQKDVVFLLLSQSNKELFFLHTIYNVSVFVLIASVYNYIYIKKKKKPFLWAENVFTTHFVSFS